MLQLSETNPKTFCQGIFLSASVLLRALNKFTAVPMLTTGISTNLVTVFPKSSSNNLANMTKFLSPP